MNTACYQFSGTLRKISTCSYVVLWIPEDIVAAVDPSDRSRRRIIADLNGFEHRCALPPGGEDTWYIIFSRRLRKDLGVDVGEEVRVRFRIDDPDRVDVPAELADALRADPRANREWEKLTPGKQRGFCHMVSSAKRAETRRSRAEKVIDSLLPLCIPFGRNRRNK